MLLSVTMGLLALFALGIALTVVVFRVVLSISLYRFGRSRRSSRTDKAPSAIEEQDVKFPPTDGEGSGEAQGRGFEAQPQPLEEARSGPPALEGLQAGGSLVHLADVMRSKLAGRPNRDGPAKASSSSRSATSADVERRQRTRSRDQY